MNLKYLFIFLVFFAVIRLNVCERPYLNSAWAEMDLSKEGLPNEKPSKTLKEEIEEPTGDITLKQAISLVLMKNPELSAFLKEIEAWKGRVLQDGLLPNPEFEIEFENFLGSGEVHDFDSLESTVQIGQPIELGGKRPKRKTLSILRQNLAQWDYESKRLDVISEVTMAFVNVLAAQERLSITEEIVNLSEEVLKTVSERVKAGKVSPIEETKARVELSTSRIELERAKSDLESARKGLSATWGNTQPTFKKAIGNLEAIEPPSPLQELYDLVKQNPDVARWSVEMKERRASLILEEAQRMPDITVNGGVRHFNETDDHAFVAGVSVPLPIFNRNQGGILEARFRMNKAEKEKEAAEIRVRTMLAEAYQSLQTAFTTIKTLENDVLPGARSTFNAVVEGYKFGKFGYLDVLDAQKTLFEVKQRYVGTLADYHKSLIDIKRLIGQMYADNRGQKTDNG